MKPPVFDYVAARTLDEALDRIGESNGDAKVLAGGQSLTPMLNFRLARPETLVDINGVPGLGEVEKSNGGLRIGTLVRHRQIETSSVIRDAFPILGEAAEQVGHLAIRNRGTFGGSIAHADPAAEWPMMARLLDAEIVAKKPGGERTINASDFFVTFLTTALEDSEIVTEVRLPNLPANSGWGFHELSRRPGDFALAAVAAIVTVEGSVCKDARISMAGVGPTPLRAPGAEALLRGQTLSTELIEQAGSKASEEADPSNDVHASADFRRHLVSVLTRRALQSAADHAS